MKNKPTLVFIIVLLIIALLMGINYFTTPFLNMFEDNDSRQQNRQTNEENLGDRNDNAQQKNVEQLLADMPVEAKVAQLITYPLVVDSSSSQPQTAEVATPSAIEATNSSAIEAVEEENDQVLSEQVGQEIQRLQPGFFIFFGSDINLNQVQDVVGKANRFYDRDSLLPLFAVDHEGGQVQRLSGSGFSQLPAWQTMCDRDDEERVKLLTRSARELSQAGINIVFAPVVDLGGSWLGTRSCSNYDNLQRAATDYIEVFGGQQVMAVIKHFPGIGSAPADLHQTISSIDLDGEDVNIFKDLLDIYPNIGVMTTHVQINNQFDGIPCSLSSRCLYALDEYWPQALVFTDALEMGALEVYANQVAQASDSAQLKIKASDSGSYLPSLAVEAIKAGNNVLVFGKDVSYEELQDVRIRLVQEYNDSPEFKQQVDYSLQKILAIKQIDYE